ncbi:3195_t:CDS:1, partial [Diversispora eburnea]
EAPVTSHSYFINYLLTAIAFYHTSLAIFHTSVSEACKFSQ